jgi:asparagine synthase (glutamine-hydrolysing)
LGNFLVVSSSAGSPGPEARFSLGLALAEKLGLGKAREKVQSGELCLASFPRWNGSGGRLARDPTSGDWLLAVGTWFHQDDFASGSEERLLQRLASVGPRALAQELEGFFVIVTAEARSHSVTVITDIAGSCHAFWLSGGDWVAVSSSSLLLASLAEPALDAVACREFLATGIVYEDRTLFRRVRKLGPARVFRFEPGAAPAEEVYWRIAEMDPEAFRGRRAVESLADSLTRAARRVGSSFARPVCDLTGGYDSRALLAAFLGAGGKFATTVSGPRESADVVLSRQIAQAFEIPHLHLEVSSRPSLKDLKDALVLTDGECDLLQYARVLVIHRQLSERFDISINGSFGELGRGYWWELLVPFTGARRPLDARRLARARYAAGSYDLSLFPGEGRADLVAHFQAVIERTLAGLSHLPNSLQLDQTYLAMRMQRWQGRLASSTNRLWPCLSPFMFRSVLETILQTSPWLRKRSLLFRTFLAQFQPRLASFPLEHGYPALPAGLKNFYRFLPLFHYYSQRAFAKLMPLSRARPLGEAATDLWWHDPELQDMLRPQRMAVARLTGTRGLADFLERSRRVAFPYVEQLSRLLSLELALQTLSEAQRAASAERAGVEK